MTTSIKEIKEIFENYNDREKCKKFENNLRTIKILKFYNEKKLLTGVDVKKSFISFHCYKMYQHYIYLLFFHINIKKLPNNEELLCYFEEKLENNGFVLESLKKLRLNNLL